MKLENIEFDTIYDVAMCFKKKRNTMDLVYKIIEEVRVQKEKKVNVVAFNSQYNFYQFDCNFILFATKEWLKSSGVSDVNIDKFLNLFDKNITTDSLDNWLLFISYLRKNGLTIGNSKKQYFTQIIYFDKKENVYFKLDAIGFVKSGIDEIVTRMYREEELDTVAINPNIESIAYGVGKGPGKVPFEMKRLEGDGKKVVSFETGK